MARILSDDQGGALTIKGEAEGESYLGKVCVGESIRERMRTLFFSNGTVFGTIFRNRQYSTWNADAANRIRILRTDSTDPVYLECMRAWYESAYTKNVPGAVQYYAPRVVVPTWLDDFELVRTVGNHEFLRRKRSA